MEYKVIVVSNPYEINAVKQFEREVKEYIRDGWKLQGGVSVTRTDYDNNQQTVLAQALIKE